MLLNDEGTLLTALQFQMSLYDGCQCKLNKITKFIHFITKRKRKAPCLPSVTGFRSNFFFNLAEHPTILL